MCGPPLFITLCPIRQAWCHLLPRTMATASVWSPAIHNISLIMSLSSSRVSLWIVVLCLLSPSCTLMHHLFVSLPLSLSLALLRHIYSFLPPPPLSLDSISSGNDGVIQLSLALCLDQSASVFHVWLCVCVYYVWLECFKCYGRNTVVAHWSVFFMKYKNHLELMNKLMEACVAAAGEYLPFFPVWQQKKCWVLPSRPLSRSVSSLHSSDPFG